MCSKANKKWFLIRKDWHRVNSLLLYPLSSEIPQSVTIHKHVDLRKKYDWLWHCKHNHGECEQRIEKLASECVKLCFHIITWVRRVIDSETFVKSMILIPKKKSILNDTQDEITTNRTRIDHVSLYYKGINHNICWRV